MHDWHAYVRRHLPPLTVSPEREHEIVSELALQLDQAYQDALAGGQSEQQALSHAQGQVRSWSDLAREINSAELQAASSPHQPLLLSGVAGDVRYALRFLRRNPVFAIIAVFTLAFGIGGNTAIFTLVDAVAIHSLPYRDPGRLMAIETRKAQQPEVEAWTSALDLFDLRDHNQSFSTIVGVSPIWSVVMTGRGPAEQLNSLYVSTGFFPMLGVNAALGRTFQAQEDQRTTPAQVVVLSHSFWQREFGGSRSAIGASLVLDDGSYTVVGVLPANFRYAGEPVAGTATDIDVWFPLSANRLASSVRDLRFLKVVGRLRDGVTLGQAQDEIHRLGVALAAQYPATNQGFSYDVQSLSLLVTWRFRVAMLLLRGAIAFVLLMACANVANLLLARAATRNREISVRVALGASRFRLLRQLLTEGLVLAALGGMLGLGVAYAVLAALIRTGPEAMVRTSPIQLDSRALAFTAAAVLLSAILAGLPPAWRMLRGDIGGLRESSRSLTAASHRLRSALVVGQVSAALILLVGAGLLARSFQRLLDVDPGFQARHVATISTLIYSGARTPAQRTAVWHQFRDRLAALPGVISVGAVSRLPLMGSNLGTSLYREGQIVSGQSGFNIEYRAATPSYFATMGIPLRAGRLFDEHDSSNPAVAIINQTAARRIWPGEDPVGKRFKLGSEPETEPWVTVIGVVGDVRHAGIDIAPLPELYRSYALNPLISPILVIRTAGDPEPMLGVLGETVRSVSSQMPAYNVYAMQDLVERSTAQRRFVMLLLGGFAAMALLLAAVGIYGTVSQAVTQRTAEIGLRMALGASPAAALSLVFGYGLQLTLAGIAVGAVAAVALTRLMTKLLFEVRPLDPEAFAAAAITLMAFALLACYLPARRATRVDPLTALRQDN
jgi:putative ABC transport system permease protein